MIHCLLISNQSYCPAQDLSGPCDPSSEFLKSSELKTQALENDSQFESWRWSSLTVCLRYTTEGARGFISSLTQQDIILRTAREGGEVGTLTVNNHSGGLAGIRAGVCVVT